MQVEVSGSSIARVPVAEIQSRMDAFFVDVNKGPREDESFHKFLSRIHGEFQLIHPFRDGNGRTGRIIMNLLALQRGYPIIFYRPEHRVLFCEACEGTNKGAHALFGRMILEAFYSSLRVYERVTGPLLPQ